MLRLFVLFNFYIFSLYACNDNCTPCIEKVQDSKSIKNKNLYVIIDNHLRITFSPDNQNAVVIKKDPFLHLYLIKDIQNFKYPFMFNDKHNSNLFIVNQKNSKKGVFVKSQIGLNSFAKFSTSLDSPALILDKCSFLKGIVTPNGIIEESYIRHFINSQDSSYSDIGIRVKDLHNNVVVKDSDPFFNNNPFKIGDMILLFDMKRVKNSAQLMQNILFSKIGSKHKVKVKRNGKIFNFIVFCKKRYGGAYLSDTFLEQYGIYFDKKLHITSLNAKFKTYGLAIGDRLVKIDNRFVSTQKDLRLYLEKFKDYSSMLFERNKFQFFVKIK